MTGTIRPLPLVLYAFRSVNDRAAKLRGLTAPDLRAALAREIVFFHTTLLAATTEGRLLRAACAAVRTIVRSLRARSARAATCGGSIKERNCARCRAHHWSASPIPKRATAATALGLSRHRRQSR